MQAATKRDLRSREEKRQAVLADTRPRTTVSFYRYVKIADPTEFRARLLATWGELECLGRIYVAAEGINAQMNVLTERWGEFDAWVQSQPELAGTLGVSFPSLQNSSVQTDGCLGLWIWLHIDTGVSCTECILHDLWLLRFPLRDGILP